MPTILAIIIIWFLVKEADTLNFMAVTNAKNNSLLTQMIFDLDTDIKKLSKEKNNQETV